MRPRRAALLAWTTAAVGILLFAATTSLGFMRGSRVLLFGAPPQSWLDVLVSTPFAAFPVVAAVIITKEPGNRFAWLLSASGFANSLANFSSEYATAALRWHGNLPLGHLAAWLSFWVWVIGSASVPMALLLFPDGRFLTRRWRIFGVVVLVNLGVVIVTQMFLADPTGQAPFANPLAVDAVTPLGKVIGLVETPILLLLVLLAAVSFGLRYRRSNSDVRHQLKWLLFALALVPVSYLLNGIANPGPTPVASPLTVASSVFQFVTQAFFLVAVSVAILRYRLYDIDVVISRTLVYGLLAAFITSVYVGIVVGVGTLVGNGGQPNIVLSIVATAIVAVAFQPVRERLQKIANRLVYGKRATPYEVLSQFSERVAETYAADQALPRMAQVLAEGTGAERATVWLRRGDELLPAASWPQPPTSNGAGSPDGLSPRQLTGPDLPPIQGADRSVAVRHQGDLLGALTVAKRTGESLTPVEEKLLADLASQAGLVMKNVGLTAELLQRLEELRASRQRLVTAQDEERRRLERNLHDGAQQNLVALKVKLGLAEAVAEKDPAKAKELVAQLKNDTDEALETLRDLARGIYPPLLADKGLLAALGSQARKATVPVEVSADGIGRYPQDIEAAVYFCVLEALQNVQKYAHAKRASVRLAEGDGTLSFEVEDDGAGFDAVNSAKGSGLTNMSDRLDALGGTLRVTSEVGRFTLVSGSVPAPILQS